MRLALLASIFVALTTSHGVCQELPAKVEMMSFDDRGAMLEESSEQLEELLDASPPPTDVFIFAHGWNNSFSEARASYTSMLNLMREVAEGGTWLGSDRRVIALGVSWPSKAWDEEGDSDADTSTAVSEDDLLMLYRAFPPSKGGDAYEQDIQTMERLLAAPSDAVDEGDYRTAAALFRKYRLGDAESDAEDRDLAPAVDSDGWFGSGYSLRDLVRFFTYWQMKARAGVVGRDGVRPRLIDRVQQAWPECRVHLVGHSFGCKVVLASLSAGAAPARPIQSAILLQGAVSYQAMSPEGGYANVIGRVAGPIVATFSEHDAALGRPYELASRLAGQTAELDAVSIYSALGRIGAETGAKFRILGHPAHPDYALSAGLFSANGQDFILGHSDLFNVPVAGLIWSAALHSPSDADAEEFACDCEDVGDEDLVDVEEANLPRIEDREVIAPTRMAATDADVATMRAYFGTLHGHTKYSDGTGMPNEAFEHARDAGGLDYIAMTEHNHTDMPNNAFVIGRNPERYAGPDSEALIPTANSLTSQEFVALYGQEVSSISKGNHLCVFDVPNVIDDTEVPNGDFDSLLEAWLPTHLDTTGKQAVVQLNHPWSNCPNSIEYGRDDFASFTAWRTRLGNVACLIEVINGPSHKEGTGLKPATTNAAEYRRYLKMGFRLAPTANQDNHKRTWGTITDARTAILMETLSKESLLEALRARRAYATLDSNLRLFTTVQGQPMGGTASGVSDGDELSVEVTIQDDDETNETYWVEVFADKVVGANATSSVSLVGTYGPLDVSNNSAMPTTFELPGLEYDGWDFLYMKVSQGPESQPEQQAYTAPVWFD